MHPFKHNSPRGVNRAATPIASARPYLSRGPQGLAMYAELFRATVLQSAPAAFPALVQQLWAAFAAGQVTETEAEELSALVMRPAPALVDPAGPGRAPRARVARPLPPEDVERRRRWAAAGRMPPALALRFTPGETAALAVVSAQVAKHGAHTLPHAATARIAGVSRSTVRNALREAKRLGLVHVRERRLSRFRSDTNVVRIVSPEWNAWNARRQGGGVKALSPSNTIVKGKGFSGYRGEGKTERKAGQRCEPQNRTRKTDMDYPRGPSSGSISTGNR
jgi:hypothetical protein